MRTEKGRLKMKTLRNTGFSFSDDLLYFAFNRG